MSEKKCFCHLNGYEVKDATARQDVETLKTKYKSFNNGDTITVENNTIYIANNDINDLEVIYPNEHFMCSFLFTVGDLSQGSIDFVSSSYVGKAPDFKQGETWEVNILDRIIASGKVVSE